jgi:hypothetical protein
MESREAVRRAIVRLDDDERGGADLVGIAVEAVGQPTNQGGLADAELALQHHHIAGRDP